MNKNRILLLSLLGAVLTATATYAKSQREVNPYAITANSVQLAEPAILKIDPDVVNTLAPNLGKLDANFKPVVRNHMILWTETKASQPSQIEWTVDAPADGRYGVTVSVKGAGTQLSVTSNGESQHASVSERAWCRVEMGEIFLQAGVNKILLEVELSDELAKKTRGGDFDISALELVRAAAREAIMKDALAMRKQPEWFKDAGYGLMFQWTNRATPRHGEVKDWEAKVNDFDLDGFIELVDDSGASYVIWSITWGQQYISAPVKSLDRLIAGRTTSRDLLGEMADRLHEKGVRLIFYYHYGYECYHSRDMDWLQAAGGLKPDKTELFTNVQSILSELGDRYGAKLDGWWFDGGARYLNCHFDGSSGADGILSAPFKEITLAALTGNSERLIAYNSWIKPRVTEYQDYYGGEGRTSFEPDQLSDGVFKSGRQAGLQAHGCFILEGAWGHIKPDSAIAKPKYSLKKLTEFVKMAEENRYPISINLEMYEDGSVSPQSAALLKALKAAVR